jgi:hypothetical protein
MRFRRRFATVWIALLGFTATTLALEYLSHTDDGCSVEVHCLACRTSIERTAAAAAPVVLPAPGDFVEVLPTKALHAGPKADPRTTASRGPPLS